LTDTILGLDFLVDYAAKISFPDRTISLKINEKLCKLGFQGAREAPGQVAEASVRLGATGNFLLLNYFVDRMENTALYESARTSNFSVAATEKLLPDAA
jgi:hypothetical protein